MPLLRRSQIEDYRHDVPYSPPPRKLDPRKYEDQDSHMFKRGQSIEMYYRSGTFDEEDFHRRQEEEDLDGRRYFDEELLNRSRDNSFER